MHCSCVFFGEVCHDYTLLKTITICPTKKISLCNKYYNLLKLYFKTNNKEYYTKLDVNKFFFQYKFPKDNLKHNPSTAAF